jgi:hypothetical protein
MFGDRLIREFGESARYFRQHLSLRSSVDYDSHRTCVCIEACVWACCTRSSHISAENLKFEAGSTIADFARPPVRLQNCGHNSQARKDHLIFFMLVARLEFMAFDQLLISLLLGCRLAIVIFLRRLFKCCLDVLIQFRLLNFKLVGLAFCTPRDVGCNSPRFVLGPCISLHSLSRGGSSVDVGHDVRFGSSRDMTIAPPTPATFVHLFH